MLGDIQTDYDNVRQPLPQVALNTSTLTRRRRREGVHPAAKGAFHSQNIAELVFGER
jgi:hypothetical protein